MERKYIHFISPENYKIKNDLGECLAYETKEGAEIDGQPSHVTALLMNKGNEIKDGEYNVIKINYLDNSTYIIIHKDIPEEMANTLGEYIKRLQLFIYAITK